MSMRDRCSTYEVIVIGSGIGGLTCAALLSSMGRRVLLLERQSKPGGYATCFKRRAEAEDLFRFDASIHTIGGCGPGGVITRILAQVGATDHVEFIRLKNRILTGIYPDRTISFPTDRDEFLALLSSEFPREASGLRRFFGLMEDLHRFLWKWKDRTLLAGVPLFFSPGFFRVAGSLRRSLQHEMDRALQDARLKLILASLIGWAGLMPEEFDFSTFTMNLMGIFDEEASYYVRGGSQQLSNALARAVSDRGGHIRFRSPVTGILLDGRSVAGVQLADGKRFFSNVVVSNADAHRTLTQMIPPGTLPAAYRRRLHRLRPSTSALVVYLGLDTGFQPPETFREAFDLLYARTYRPTSAALSLRETGPLPYLGISNYTNVDPSVAPPGKKVVTLMVPMEMGELRDWGLANLEDRTEAYARIKEDLADRLIHAAEDVYPDMRRHIRVKEVATPVTLYRYTGNAHGAFLGYSYRAGRGFIGRPAPRTPVRGLYLAGAWTRPGGGIKGVAVSGMIAAELVRKTLASEG